MVEDRINLQIYYSHCLKLRRDLEAAIEDLKHQDIEGPRTRFAADFSEIHAFAVPKRKTDAERFALFLDKDTELGLSLQRISLRKFFFGLERSIILMAPYAVELDAFVTALRWDVLENLVMEAPQVIDATNSIAETSELERILILAEKAELQGRALTADERRTFLEFFEVHAPILLRFIEQKDMNPLRRLSELFRRERLVDLQSIVQVNEEDFDNVANRWFKRLTRNRQRAQSRIDALAISALARGNQILKDKGERILLVTRSRTMHAIMEQEVQEGLWEQTGGNLLRHPRVFGLLSSVEGLPIGEAIENLEARFRAVSSFVDLTTNGEFKRIDLDKTGSFFSELLTRIQDEWRATESLAASAGGAYLSEAGVPTSNEVGKIGSILRVIRDRSELRKMLSSRLEELSGELEKEHELLGFYVQSMKPSDRRFIRQNLEVERYKKKGVLKTSLQSMPYSLQFFSDSAQGLLGLLGKNRSRSWQSILDFFHLGFDGDANYEKLLAMALMLGALNRWRLAESYCRRARSLQLNDEWIPSFESAFFLALCKRKWDPSVARYLEALELLDSAAEDKRIWIGKSDYRDPRFLKEKAVHILLLNDLQRQTEDSSVETVSPSDQDALGLLDEAEARVENDLELHLQIVNNRLFYKISVSPEDLHENLKEEYESLLKIIRSYENDQAEWPPFVKDTIAWAKFRIFGVTSTSEKDEILALFDDALTSPELSRDEFSLIKSHRRVVAGVDVARV